MTVNSSIEFSLENLMNCLVIDYISDYIYISVHGDVVMKARKVNRNTCLEKSRSLCTRLCDLSEAGYFEALLTR